MKKKFKNLLGLISILVTTHILHGCAAPVAAAYVGYHMQNAADSTNGGDMTCNEIKEKIANLDGVLENYYTGEINKTLRTSPSAAGGQITNQVADLATGHAVDLAATHAPETAQYIQPIVATAKTILGNNFPASVEDTKKLSNTLSDEYKSKCLKNKVVAANPETLEIQVLLNNKGYPCGAADGIYGRKTNEAIRQYQMNNGLLVDGVPSTALLAKLRSE